MKSKLIEKLPETFIIFDTEFTSWEGSMERNWSGENEHRELVQISAIRVKKKGGSISITKKLNLYVKPLINKNLSEYFTNLTGISQDVLDDKALPFKQAIKIFYQFCKNSKNEKYNLYSMGNDYDVIKENLRIHSVNKKSRFYKWEKKFVDIGPFFSRVININNYSSGTIYKAFDIVPHENVKVHDARWDTLSLFLSFRELLRIV